MLLGTFVNICLTCCKSAIAEELNLELPTWITSVFHKTENTGTVKSSNEIFLFHLSAKIIRTEGSESTKTLLKYKRDI
jgi:hypothetical protein